MNTDDTIEVMDSFLHGDMPQIIFDDQPGVVVDIHSRPNGDNPAPFYFDVMLSNGSKIRLKAEHSKLIRGQNCY